MGIGAIPIPMLVDSHSYFHLLFNSCFIPMVLPWDFHSHMDSQPHTHLYSMNIHLIFIDYGDLNYGHFLNSPLTWSVVMWLSLL